MKNGCYFAGRASRLGNMVTGEGTLVSVCFQTYGVSGEGWHSVSPIVNVSLIDELHLGSPGRLLNNPTPKLQPWLAGPEGQRPMCTFNKPQMLWVHFVVGDTAILMIIGKDGGWKPRSPSETVGRRKKHWALWCLPYWRGLRRSALQPSRIGIVSFRCHQGIRVGSKRTSWGIRHRKGHCCFGSWPEPLPDMQSCRRCCPRGFKPRGPGTCLAPVVLGIRTAVWNPWGDCSWGWEHLRCKR